MEKNKSGECSCSYSSSSSDDDSYERRGDGYGSSGADVSGGCSTSTATSSQLTFTPANVGDAENEIRTASSEGCSCSSPSPLALVGGRDRVVWEDDTHKLHSHISEMDMMKERFSKLLLGEDMSGCGKGVCSALCLSNAITNLSASVFGELWRLEPLSSAKKDMWKREMDWLLCVSDSIVELIPTWQETPEGGTQEIMVSRPRSDLYINLPALRKLDAMLLVCNVLKHTSQEILDNFSEEEFWYVDREIYYGGGNVVGYAPIRRFSQLQGEKWWLPSVKVPANGLSEQTRKYLQNHKECCSQILKASMAINSHVLSEMEVPKSYIDSLPKTGKASLGDIVYRYITAEQFSPEHLLDCLDLSSEHHILEIANRIESAVHIWKQKAANKRQHNVKLSRTYSSSWGRVKTLLGDVEKDMLTERAETLLMTLKLRFPGLSQTVLDMNKIQHNKDVGQSILESYSRVLESLAYNIIARIDDILQADDMAKHFTPNRPSAADSYNRARSTSDYSSSVLVPMPSSSAFPTPFATPIFSPLIKDI